MAGVTQQLPVTIVSTAPVTGEPSNQPIQAPILRLPADVLFLIFDQLAEAKLVNVVCLANKFSFRFILRPNLFDKKGLSTLLVEALGQFALRGKGNFIEAVAAVWLRERPYSFMNTGLTFYRFPDPFLTSLEPHIDKAIDEENEALCRLVYANLGRFGVKNQTLLCKLGNYIGRIDIRLFFEYFPKIIITSTQDRVSLLENILNNPRQDVTYIFQRVYLFQLSKEKVAELWLGKMKNHTRCISETIMCLTFEDDISFFNLAKKLIELRYDLDFIYCLPLECEDHNLPGMHFQLAMHTLTTRYQDEVFTPYSYRSFIDELRYFFALTEVDRHKLILELLKIKMKEDLLDQVVTKLCKDLPLLCLGENLRGQLLYHLVMIMGKGALLANNPQCLLGFTPLSPETINVYIPTLRKLNPAFLWPSEQKICSLEQREDEEGNLWYHTEPLALFVQKTPLLVQAKKDQFINELLTIMEDVQMFLDPSLSLPPVQILPFTKQEKMRIFQKFFEGEGADQDYINLAKWIRLFNLTPNEREAWAFKLVEYISNFEFYLPCFGLSRQVNNRLKDYCRTLREEP